MLTALCSFLALRAWLGLACRAIFEASLRELLLGGASGQGGHAVQLYEQAGGSGTWKMIK